MVDLGRTWADTGSGYLCTRLLNPSLLYMGQLYQAEDPATLPAHGSSPIRSLEPVVGKVGMFHLTGRAKDVRGGTCHVGGDDRVEKVCRRKSLNAPFHFEDNILANDARSPGPKSGLGGLS